VDPLTHGLASLAVQRGFFPRVSWRGILAIVFAGMIADVDWFSASFGPAAYLRWHRTSTHSIALVVLLAVAALVSSRTIRNHPSSAAWSGFTWPAAAVASTLHVLMDLLQADAVAPLWPFSVRRISLDVVPSLDPWLLVILSAAILLPELSRLVNDEIGSRAKRPRGRNGAIAGIAFALIFIALRALFHGNVTAALEARTVSGEMPRRSAAFPDFVSPFLWHAVIETDSALYLATMRSMGGDVNFASGITTLRKPEPSPVLNAAQASPAAVIFVQTARFPKAIVQTETEGYSVEILDLKDQATEERSRAILADITLDKTAKVVSSELQWQKTFPRP
jgi:inner membrane protein